MADPADRVEDADQVENEDDAIQGKPIFLIRPDENVYSYFMFIGPTEGKKQEVRSRNNTPRDGVPGAGAHLVGHSHA